MVTSLTGKGVNVLGGMIAPGEYSKAMFELSASMQWTRLDNSPTGKGVIVTGGITEKDSKAIFELSQLIQWTKYDIHDPQGNDRKVLMLKNLTFRAFLGSAGSQNMCHNWKKLVIK